MIWKKKFSPIAVGTMLLIAIDSSIAASLSNIVDDSTLDTNTDEQHQRRPKSINKNNHQQGLLVLNAVDKLNRRLDTSQLHHRRIKAQSTKAQLSTSDIEEAKVANNNSQRILNQNDSLYYKILKEDHINEVGSTYYKSHYDNMIKEATNHQAVTTNNGSSSNEEESSIEEEEEDTGWGPFVEHIEEEVDTAHHAHIIHHSATTENTQDPIDTLSPSPSPSPEMTSYLPSSYYPLSYSPSPSPDSSSYSPSSSHDDNVNKSTAKDRMTWTANGGETTLLQQLNYCLQEYEMIIDHTPTRCKNYSVEEIVEDCLGACWQYIFGYSTESSGCFANIHQCSMNNGCMESCSTNMTSVECIECDKPCIDELYDCTGFPQVPNTDGSGKSGKSGVNGKGGKSGVDGKGGKSG